MINKNSPTSSYRWKHNGDGVDGWNNQLTVTIPSVVKSDEGIYSCFVDGQENQQLHGIMRLIVRGWIIHFCYYIPRMGDSPTLGGSRLFYRVKFYYLQNSEHAAYFWDQRFTPPSSPKQSMLNAKDLKILTKCFKISQPLENMSNILSDDWSQIFRWAYPK